ncbi:hypothetical protein GE265_17140 [Streptomyces clavuligerus]|nr:hypothetical protein GE265_17140 [Streptomyces clavuligerus]
MEICIAVADRARGPTTWVLSRPGGAGTGEARRKRTRGPWEAGTPAWG